MIVHATRMELREPFDVDWLTSDGETIQRDEDLIGEGEWRVYSLDLSGLSPGRYFVRTALSETLAFQMPFTVSP